MLKTGLFVLTTAAIAVLSGCASPSPSAQGSAQSIQVASAAPLSYQGYDKILQTYVNAQGFVDYQGLQADPQPLKDVVAQIGAVAPTTYASWSEADKIAFLINAYNAITLESIINQKPLKKSIKDIFGVWNFAKHTVAGETKTLDDIEHKTLRKNFNEPRIHAALVCAALSCPPLRREPYVGAKLNEQLDDQVRQWLSNERGLKIDRAQNQVAISSIFKWFGDDWKKSYGIADQFAGKPTERAVLNFISRYVSPEDRSYLAQRRYKLQYLNYDWSLNRQ
ncbi:MAG: DUF547 domain-containing protein [Thermosynechococcaceae cyanobacterium MS004]|nr:DUF547 domain-containing protein [Thermosynechococcaceae cyanobacterium MS004]